MNRIAQLGFGALLTAGVAIALLPASEARSVSAFAGQPQAPADYSCFTNANGAITNTCSTTRRYCVALPVDSADHFIDVTVRAPSITQNLSCFATSVSRDAIAASFTGVRSPSIFGISQTIPLGWTTVPPTGALFSCCDLMPGSSLQSINY